MQVEQQSNTFANSIQRPGVTKWKMIKNKISCNRQLDQVTVDGVFERERK